MSSHADAIKRQVIAAAQKVFDPEIPVNIYELGLVYSIDVSEESNVHVRMTLTSPNCPVADKLPQELQQKIAAIQGVRSAKVELTFEPPWTREMMSELAQMELETMGVASPAHLHGSRTTDLTIGRHPRRDAHHEAR